MARRRGGDGDGGNVKDLTVEILKQIRGELRDTNARLATLERATVAGFRHLTDRFDQLGTRFDQLGDRFEHALGFAGDRYRDHERRLGKLERHVFPRRAT